MPVRILQRSAVSFGVVSLLFGCGGGSDIDAASSPSAAPAAPTETHTAAVVITPQMVFDFAQATFKDLFPTATAPVAISGLAFEGKVLEVRGYSNGNFLAVSTANEIWGLGPYTSNAPYRIGTVSEYACQIAPSSCVVDPPPPPPPPTATYNECIDPNASSLPTGFRLTLVFTYLGLLTGDQTVETVIDGPGFSFEGQQAIQATSTTTGTNTVSVGGFTVTATTTTKNKTYQQKSSSGLLKSLGGQSEGTTSTPFPTFPGVPTQPPVVTTVSFKTVYTPPVENIEYTLALGKSLDKQVTTIITSSAGTQSTTGTQRFTFEAKESITLSNGKSYSTCRYKNSNVDGSNATTTWFMVGKGVPVRTTSIVDGKTQTVELKSGNYNGTPL